MKVSYYELLGMIKEGNIPEKVIYKGDTYIWKGKRYQKTENGQFLSDMDEICVFEKCIEIPNNDFEDIKPLVLKTFGRTGEAVTIDRFEDYTFDNFKLIEDALAKVILNQKKIINILKIK